METILAKHQFFPDEELIHNFLYYDPDKRISLGGKTRIITVELIKTKPIADKPIEKMTKAELWAVYFQYLTDEGKRGKIIDIINQEEGIAMATETLSKVTQDEIEYARMTTLLKSELDYQSGMVNARRSGIKEGEEKANFNNAKKMKADNMSVSLISKYTGLSAETINQL